MSERENTLTQLPLIVFEAVALGHLAEEVSTVLSRGKPSWKINAATSTAAFGVALITAKATLKWSERHQSEKVNSTNQASIKI